MGDLAETTGGLVTSNGTKAYHAAVEPATGVLLAVAWEAAAIHLAGWAVSASRPCVFVLRSWPNGTVHGSASIPDGGGELRLTVASPSGRGQKCVLRFVASVEGDELGKSVSASCVQ